MAVRHHHQHRPFTPLQVPGILFWLEADKQQGVASGGVVATAPDLSGKNNPFAQDQIDTYKPTWVAAQVNGQPVYRFDGTAQYLRAATALWTRDLIGIVVLMKAAGSQQNRGILSQNNAGAGRFSHTTRNSVGGAEAAWFFNNGSSVTILSTTVAYDNTFKIVRIKVDGNGRHAVGVNGGPDEGTLTGQTLFTPQNDRTLIGCVTLTGGVPTTPLNCVAMDLVGMVGCQNDQQIDKVERYFSRKYAIGAL